jgi:hypothetical protein
VTQEVVWPCPPVDGARRSAVASNGVVPNPLRSCAPAGTIGFMSVTRWFPHDPDIGSPVVHEYGDPAMADKVVHCVGRQRGSIALPLAVRHLSAEQRLANILNTRQLLGWPVYQSQLLQVACVSDLSAAELETAFARGLNTRGRLEPWAVVLDRPLAWQAGFRPVMYVEAERIQEVRAAMAEVLGPNGPALVVRTEMGTDDWTAEREWRFCFDPPPPVAWTVGDPPPPPQPPAGLALNDAVRAVIVGTSGWVPRWPLPSPSGIPPERWLWDETSRRLVHDGRLPAW